jgi:hypothetical protein
MFGKIEPRNPLIFTGESHILDMKEKSSGRRKVMPTTLSALRANKYRVPKGTKTVELKCGCKALYLPPLPRIGEDAFCRTCDSWTTRIKIVPGPSLLRWAQFLVGRTERSWP